LLAMIGLRDLVAGEPGPLEQGDGRND